jgi:nucleotide-binding universal stress UspA family protein
LTTKFLNRAISRPRTTDPPANEAKRRAIAPGGPVVVVAVVDVVDPIGVAMRRPSRARARLAKRLPPVRLAAVAEKAAEKVADAARAVAAVMNRAVPSRAI